MRRYFIHFCLSLAVLLGFYSHAVYALQAVPELSAHVIDQTHTLQVQEQQQLEQQLSAIEKQYGSQVVLLMVATTEPEDITAYANRVASTWKIGRAKIGDGLLIVMAKDDHTIRFEVSRALEGAIPDVLAYRIINQMMMPYFKQGEFFQGLHMGINAVETLIKGEDLPKPDATTDPNKDGIDLQTLFVLLLVIIPILSPIMAGIFGKKIGSIATGICSGAIAWLLSGAIILTIIIVILVIIFTLIMGSGGGGGSGSGGIGGGPFMGGLGGRNSRGGWGSGGGSSWGSGGGGSFGGGGASGKW